MSPRRGDTSREQQKGGVEKKKTIRNQSRTPQPAKPAKATSKNKGFDMRAPSTPTLNNKVEASHPLAIQPEQLCHENGLMEWDQQQGSADVQAVLLKALTNFGEQVSQLTHTVAELSKRVDMLQQSPKSMETTSQPDPLDAGNSRGEVIYNSLIREKSTQPKPEVPNCRRRGTKVSVEDECLFTALKFLSRPRLDKLQAVSKQFHQLISTREGNLRARYLNRMWIETRKKIETDTFDSEGFLTTGGNLTNYHVRFQDVFHFQTCCTRLKESLRRSSACLRLAGFVRIADAPAEEIVTVRVDLPYGKMVDFSVQNLLTVKSAFHYLHLLSHLNNCHVGTLNWGATLSCRSILKFLPSPTTGKIGKVYFRLTADTVNFGQPYAERLCNIAAFLDFVRNVDTWKPHFEDWHLGCAESIPRMVEAIFSNYGRKFIYNKFDLPLPLFAYDLVLFVRAISNLRYTHNTEQNIHFNFYFVEKPTMPYSVLDDLDGIIERRVDSDALVLTFQCKRVDTCFEVYLRNRHSSIEIKEQKKGADKAMTDGENVRSVEIRVLNKKDSENRKKGLDLLTTDT